MSDALGRYVLLMGINYIYYGKLIKEHPNHVELEDCCVVYETGNWSNSDSRPAWKDSQRLPVFMQPWRVLKGAFESWGVDGRSEDGRSE